MKTICRFGAVKNILIFLALLISCQSKSDQLSYTRDGAIDYLASRSDVYVVMKVGGRIPYNEYKEYLIDEIVEDELFEAWKNIEFSEKEKFLVLKKYRGREKVGGVISAVQLSDYGVTKIGKKYLLFLGQTSKAVGFEFGACDAFELNSVPGHLLDDFEKMISYVGKSTMNPCLYHVEYDPQ